MAGKNALCPNCKAVIAIPEAEMQIAPWTPTDQEIPTSLDISARAPTDDEKAALRVVRNIYVFFRDDWRRLLTCAHLWPVFFLFFLPWVNLSCSGRTIATQTGLQASYGGVTIDARLEKAVGNNKAAPKDDMLKDQPPWSILSSVFIVFVFLGGLFGAACIGCVFLRMSTIAAAAHLFSLGLGGAAFLALAALMTFGFPIERHSKQQIEKKRLEQQRGMGAAGADDAFFDIDVRYTFWLWLSSVLCFISVPVFLLEFVILIMQTIKHHSRQRDDTG
jgi:hypothetical protein